MAVWLQAGLRAHEESSLSSESPSRGNPQWRCDSLSLAYRCGGSAGLACVCQRGAPASRFTPWANARGAP